MDDTNHVVVDLHCPRCGERGETRARMRYGPAGHPALEVGATIEWGHAGERLGGPSEEPEIDVPAVASCTACAKLATAFGKREWKRLRPATERVVESDDGLARRRGLELGHLLAHLDYQYRLKQPVVLAGEPISAPGRLIEKTGELVLGYSPALFDGLAARVRIDRDRVARVEVLPIELQEVLKVFPVSIHYGSFAAGHAAVLDALDAVGAGELADALVRAGLALEMGEWAEVLGDDAEGRMELATKVRHLLAQLGRLPARVAALHAIDRFTAVDERERLLGEALGIPADRLATPEDALTAALR